MTEQTKVVFRKWRDMADGDIIALFPEMPSDAHGVYCSSYERIGQHGGADYSGVIARTVPASKREYAELKRELERIGYSLQVCQRASHSAFSRRWEAIYG